MASVDKRASAIVLSQFNRYYKNKLNSDNFILLLDENNCLHATILIFGLRSEFKNGEYICSFEIPNNFPDSPPKHITMHTPNGVMDVNSNICVSIGEFHGHQPKIKGGSVIGWPKGRGLFGFGTEIVNALCNWEGVNGIGYHGDNTTNAEKQKLANDSIAFNNKHNRDYVGRFNNFIEENKDQKCVQDLLAYRQIVTQSNSDPVNNMVEQVEKNISTSSDALQLQTDNELGAADK